MNIRVQLRGCVSSHSLGVVAHVHVHGIWLVSSNVSSQFVNRGVEQLLLSITFIFLV